MSAWGGGDDPLLITAGGFTDDQKRRGEGLQLDDEPALTGDGVEASEVMVGEVYLERVFGNIQTDI